jgi:TolB-like protein/cytochrome c-type biogenesis protein CcmH/NrfG
MSSDPEEGYFADGMTEELITSLSGIRQLTVIARTSVMKYKGSQKGASDVGKELNAGTLIEGSVRKAGNRLRITAQLIDTSTEGHLWAQNYDRQLEDVFAIQSEIAEKVAGELRIRLVDSEKRVIEKKGTENTEAYTYYLRGRELTRERTEASLRQAKGLFEKSIQLDPSFAKAHSGLAECFIHLANDSYEPYEQSIPKAELSVKKALQLDPELAEAHATLAFIDFVEDNVSGSEAEARRAIELNPSIPEAYYIMANIALLKGGGDEGIKAAEAAYHLDPVGPRYVERLGSLYFYTGRESEAVQFWEKTAELAPAGTYRNLTEYYMFKGNLEKARDFFGMAEKLEPTNPWATWMKGFIAAQTSDRNTSLEAIRRIEENWSGAVDLNGIGFIHYALGDLDSYFTYLNRATDQHLLQYVYPMYCPLFAQARTDPRYKELMEKVRRQLGLAK